MTPDRVTIFFLFFHLDVLLDLLAGAAAAALLGRVGCKGYLKCLGFGTNVPDVAEVETGRLCGHSHADFGADLESRCLWCFVLDDADSTLRVGLVFEFVVVLAVVFASQLVGDCLARVV